MPRLRALVGLLALAAGAAAQSMVYELPAPAGVRHYGQSLAALDDLDGDGVPDFALSALSSRVELRSGRDGALLALRESASDGFAQVLAPAGDVDGDGLTDLAVGSPGLYTGGGGCPGCPAPTPGAVEVLSGRDLAPLLLLGEQGGTDDEFGCAVASLGDVDGDGRADLAVGAAAHEFHAWWQFAGVPGRVFAFSGADGALLWTATGLQARDAFGIALAPLPDLDGDGVGELAVGASGALGGPAPQNAVDLLSGATGARLRRLPAPYWPGTSQSFSGFGASLAVVPDSDGDGEPELLVGLSETFADAGGALRVRLVDGALLASLFPLGPSQSGLGAQLAAGDLTGDGAPELLLGSDGRSELALGTAAGAWLNGLGTGEAPAWPGSSAAGALASCAALPGDLTGDGVPDLLMGESGSGGDARSYGRVRLFAGGALSWSLELGPHPDDRFAPRLRGSLTRTPVTAFSPDAPLIFRVAAGFEVDGPPVELPGRLVLGLQALPQPWLGGVLVPAPQFSVPFTVSSPAPFATPLALDVPSGLPAGLVFWAQAVTGTAGAGDGVRFSEAWRGELP